MLVVVALHKGLVGAMVSEQGSLAASGGDGDKPPGKDGEDRREKDTSGKTGNGRIGKRQRRNGGKKNIGIGMPVAKAGSGDG